MSQNIDQIFTNNPASSMLSTDLLYLGRSPYNATDDYAILFSNFQTSITALGQNVGANNFVPGYTTTATAAGTTTLTAASNYLQFFTGSTTQTVVLPVTSTLALGLSYEIVNLSSGAVTVQSSGLNTITTIAAGASAVFTCILTSGTTAASWNSSYNQLEYPVPINKGGTGVTSVTTAPTASAWAGWDANDNLSANNFLRGYTTTATAAGTTTLTVSSTYFQFFTGSTTQTVVLPVTSTLVLGQEYEIINNSTGVVTVQSSGANTVVALGAGQRTFVTCILTSGATAASWYTSSSATFGNLTTGALTSTSINFGGSTLSTYVQGSWTPGITFATPGNLNVTYGTASGNYTRVGNVVTVSFYLAFTATYTTASGNVQITGLPVQSGSYCIGTFIDTDGIAFPTGCTQAALYAQSGYSVLSVNAQGSGTSVANFTTTQVTSGISRIWIGSITYLV